MPVPPARPRNINPELTARAQAFHARAYVEIENGRAWLDLLGTRFDLGDTMRTSRAELDRQIDFFARALASAKTP